MTKISYKGMELEEFVSDKAVAFQQGTKAICWNGDDFEKSCKAEHELIAFIPYIRCQVLTIPPDGGVLTFWDHCAIIYETISENIVEKAKTAPAPKNSRTATGSMLMCSVEGSQETFGCRHLNSKKLFVTSASPER